ncbi:MAG: hypothetical protein K0R29_1231 [Pseudobdellovibrio sp.]|jgi:hypothetical protein|nr:hypothetical protein [Pseudobdellovibrio sp.]
MTSHRLFLNSKFRLEIIAGVLLVAVSVLLMYLGANHILDTKVYYSHDEAMAYFNALGTTGTENYKLIALLDLFVYIPAYTWLLLLFAKRFLPEKYWMLVLIPTVFDILETSVIYLFLSGYLSNFPVWTGYVTSIKWISGAVIVLAIGANLFKRNPRSD